MDNSNSTDTYFYNKLIFTKSFINTISTLTGLSVDKLDENYDEMIDHIEMVGTIILTGNKNAIMMLMTEKSTLATIVSYMTGMATSDITDVDLQDSIAELVNIIAGSAKIDAAKYGDSFNVSSPFTITGDNMNLIHKQKLNNQGFHFMVDDMQVILKILYC